MLDKDFVPETEEELDKVLVDLGIMMNAEDSKASIINIPRLQQVNFTYLVAKYLAKSIPGSTVTYKLNEPFKTIGSVTIEAPALRFSKLEWFARAAEFASNTEVYPLANGNIRLTFGFYGLTTPLE